MQMKNQTFCQNKNSILGFIVLPILFQKLSFLQLNELEWTLKSLIDLKWPQENLLIG